MWLSSVAERDDHEQLLVEGIEVGRSVVLKGAYQVW